jgi:glucokinase
VKRITGSVEKVLTELRQPLSKVLGIGIGSTGPVDSETGRILECPQLPTMHYFNLLEAIQTHFGIPVRLNNDANCLIFGESIAGAAVHHKSVVGFTLGTGIGAAIVSDKRIMNGSTGTAAEIWPSPYQTGTIEDYVSGAGVSRIYQSYSGKVKSSLEVYNLARGGDKKALSTWVDYGRHLAVPIAWTINLIDPEIVVIGGSISNAFPFFKNSMEMHLRKWICPVPAEKTKVVLAKLGENAGFIGAACLIL